MRVNDIDDLIQKIECEINTFHITVEGTDMQILEIKDNILNRVDVKNVFENIRSILDYCALDIFENISKGSNKRIYFPYAKNRKNFVENVKGNFGKLKENNLNIFSLVESIQDFACQNKWLYTVCKFTNERKHDSLGKQHKEIYGSGYELGGGFRVENSKNVHFRDCNIINATTGEVTSLGKDGNSVTIKEGMLLHEVEEQLNKSIQIEVINGKARSVIVVENDRYDLLNLLDTAISELKRFVCQLYLLIEQQIK